MIKTFMIDDEEMGIFYQDMPPWRSYHLTACGDSENEMISDAIVSEVDQDGGDLGTYPIADATSDVYARGLEMIREKLKSRASA